MSYNEVIRMKPSLLVLSEIPCNISGLIFWIGWQHLPIMGRGRNKQNTDIIVGAAFY